MKILKWIGIVLLVLLVAVGSLFLIYVRPVMQKMAQTHTVRFDHGLTLILGGGGNTGIFTSDSLVVVIDSKMGDAAKHLADTVKDMAGRRPILVVNTHWHGDHTGGNKYFKGQMIMAGGRYTPETWRKEAGDESLPTKWLDNTFEIRRGRDTITFVNLGKDIHTPSDIVVYDHRRKMLFGGDVILNRQVPAIFGAADPDGYLWALEWLPTRFDIRTVVPGHGPVGGIEVIENFKTYFRDMKLAAMDPSKKDSLVKKYDDWVQVPIVMSPNATIRAYHKKMNP
jgi:glyoxylase-like metal-dependent hydrolase (beta-lactamase superfamily II)